jgi:hypothetical protein
MGRIAQILVLAALAAGGASAQDAQTTAEPALVLDARRLRAVYMDLLGRPPLAEERERWLGRGTYELLDLLLGCEDAWRHWFEEQLYYFLLIDNFRPETERVMAIPEDLAAGRIDVREAIHRIALCSSFDARNPGADTFVTVVMEQLDGLEVQKATRELEVGKRIYDGSSGMFLGKSGRNQADIVRIALEHERFMLTFVEREYRRLVRAEPERGELARQARELRRDPRLYTAYVREWLASPAYAQRLVDRRMQPNRLFVRALFVDLLGRLPSQSEEARMRNALDGLSDPGPLRSVLARLLIDSGQAELPAREAIPDPTLWVAGLFERLLGRSATQPELAAFVSAFHDPACQPGTVVYAIVSHPEYHRY